jgi:hypothetical protein
MRRTTRSDFAFIGRLSLTICLVVCLLLFPDSAATISLTLRSWNAASTTWWPDPVEKILDHSNGNRSLDATAFTGTNPVP